jgi:hypothetical protein
MHLQFPNPKTNRMQSAKSEWPAPGGKWEEMLPP